MLVLALKRGPTKFRDLTSRSEDHDHVDNVADGQSYITCDPPRMRRKIMVGAPMSLFREEYHAKTCFAGRLTFRNTLSEEEFRCLVRVVVAVVLQQVVGLRREAMAYLSVEVFEHILQHVGMNTASP